MHILSTAQRPNDSVTLFVYWENWICCVYVCIWWTKWIDIIAVKHASSLQTFKLSMSMNCYPNYVDSLCEHHVIVALSSRHGKRKQNETEGEKTQGQNENEGKKINRLTP